MKILCEVQVVNRLAQATRLPRAVKSTLAIGYKQNALDANGNTKRDLEMILFRPQTKTGQHYKIKDNIHAVHTKFILDGKATIGFKQPAENLLIKCDPLQLRAFLQTLKNVKNLKLNVTTPTDVINKSQSLTKMVINRPSDYPTMGFPRSLQTLKINNSQLVQLSIEVCSLRNLTHLDVASNNLSTMPVELGSLSLTNLVLHGNNLGELNDWSWLNGSKLRDSLRELDLSANGLSHFPSPVVKCHNLVNLNLNYNNLTHLPFALRRLQKLRSLFVSENKLESLPAIIDDLHIQSLDVWGNSFKTLNLLGAARLAFASDSHSNRNLVRSPHPLWLEAARCVAEYKLPTDSLPAILIELIAEAPKCFCGKLCYAFDKHQILERVIQPKFVNVKNLTYSREHMIYADVVICGNNCSIRNQCRNLFSFLIP